jgi:hypothetical protein
MRKANLRKHIDCQTDNTGQVAIGTNQEPKASEGSTNVVELVWKYFQDEIRQALLEVQEALGDESLDRGTSSGRNRKENERDP